MKYDMKVYYTVLHYLRDFFIDREYPIRFRHFDGSYNCDEVVTSIEYISTHKYSYKISGISEGDIVTFPVHYSKKYDTCDKFEINVSSSNEFTSSDISVLFSESYTGEPVKKELTNTSNTAYEANTVYCIDYVLKNTATTLDKKNKYLNNLFGISLKFNRDFDVVYLSDMVFKTIEHQRTLEEIDYNIEDSKNHIKERICQKHVPEELSHLIPKGAAAYSWLMWWENEGRVMSDGTNKARNYYDRLMSEVNEAIDKWLEYEKESEPDDINTDLVGYVRVNKHARNKCFSRNPRRFGKRINQSRYL